MNMNVCASANSIRKSDDSIWSSLQSLEAKVSRLAELSSMVLHSIHPNPEGTVARPVNSGMAGLIEGISDDADRATEILEEAKRRLGSS